MCKPNRPPPFHYSFIRIWISADSSMPSAFLRNDEYANSVSLFMLHVSERVGTEGSVASSLGIQLKRGRTGRIAFSALLMSSRLLPKYSLCLMG